RPAARRWRSGDRDVTAERDQNAGADDRRCGACGAIRSESLRRRTEVELDAGRDLDDATSRVELDLSPAGDDREARAARARPHPQQLEAAVVAGEPERTPDRRIEQPPAHRRGTQGHVDRLE